MVAMAKRTKRKTSALSGQEAYLWSVYQADRSIANRNALVEFYLPVLDAIAKRVHQVVYTVRREDLISDGVIGLIQSIERFKPGCGWKFMTYAGIRIWGAMFDAMRLQDNIPRYARDRAKKLQKASERWEVKHEKPPSDRQLAYLLRIPVASVPAWKRDAATCLIETLSLNNIIYENSWRMESFASHIRDDATREGNVVSDMQEWWTIVLRGLNKRERYILVLYFAYDWTLRQIGIHFGIAESRVSQVVAKTLDYLKQYRNREEFSDIISGTPPPMRLLEILPYCSRMRKQQAVKRQLLAGMT
jgi:RNA polymerase sigma factor for flagellar operon FliA